MNLLGKQIYALALVFCLFKVSAQVPKRVIVEHFTNSLCGICANRNPAFFTNLNNQDSVLHLAFHPSSPYASCVFNMHNVAQNDGRTNFYGIYGSTPRLVIQGVPISAAANYGNASIFTPYINQTSPASIKLQQFKVGNDSVKLVVVVKTEAAHSLTNLKIFVALVENPIFYSAPNGENQHRNVFRKSVTSVNGDNFSLPASIGDSSVFTITTAISSSWNFNAIYSLAMLQESGTNNVVQSAASKSGDGSPMSIPKNSFQQSITLFPNPANTQLTMKNNSKASSEFFIYNSAGSLVGQGLLSEEITLDTSELSSGLYFVRVSFGTKEMVYKFVKNN